MGPLTIPMARMGQVMTCMGRSRSYIKRARWYAKRESADIKFYVGFARWERSPAFRRAGRWGFRFRQ